MKHYDRLFLYLNRWLFYIYRRRSKVVISSAKPEDSGRYECVAESTSGHRASLAAQLLVAHDTRIPETSELLHITFFAIVYANLKKSDDSFTLLTNSGAHFIEFI